MMKPLAARSKIRFFMLALAFALTGSTLLSSIEAHAQQSEADYIKSEVETGTWLTPASRPFFHKLYSDRGYQPIWTNEGQLNSRATELRSAVFTTLPAHGLPSKDYWTQQIESFFQPTFDPRAWLAAEMALSKIYMDAAIQVSTGRLSPDSISKDIKFTRRQFLDWSDLQSAANNGGISAMLDRLAPQHEGYKRLQTALARLREVQAQGGFGVLAPSRSTLRVGVNAPIVKSIKTRVSKMGYFVSSIDTVYDSELSEIIKDIQDHNMANPTGVLGPRDAQSWEYFSVSSAKRIQQIEINMEKYRWLPRQFENKYLFVNLATQKLKLVDPSNTMESVKEMRVVNGRPTRKTPSMRDETSAIVFNPTWGVPPTVFAEDKLTKIRDLLSTQGWAGFDAWMDQMRFTIMDSSLQMNLDPKTADFFIVQQPGYNNALGVAKIVLKNPWSIYMHDTNERELFTQSMRARSSGCIRLQRPLDMVEYLLQGSEWNRAKIEDYVAKPGETKEKETWVKIPQQNKLAIYTMSLTAQVGDDNIIRFTSDAYQQNAQILTALQANGFYKP